MMLVSPDDDPGGHHHMRPDSPAQAFTVSSRDEDEGSMDSTSKAAAGEVHFVKHIGCGSFGEIYSGVNKKTKECVAIKVESNAERHPQVKLHISGTGI